MKWKHTVPNAVDQISLHDCRITSAAWQDNTLTLSFKDGFILTPNLEQNPHHAVAAADCGEVVFPHCNGFTVRILTNYRLRIFDRVFCLRRCWRELTEEKPGRFAEFIAKHSPVIITEYHESNLTGHCYECFTPSLNRYFSILTLVRPNGRKFWRPIFSSKAYDRFEKKHWNEAYDFKEISLSSFSETSLRISADSQESNILYRWNNASPYE